jgi:hypothetical protein
MSHIPSTSLATKTSDPQSSGPSASLEESENTSGKIERDPDVPKPAAEGETPMEYFSH